MYSRPCSSMPEYSKGVELSGIPFDTGTSDRVAEADT
jgi:hypothetical protein